ncbi:hypothetical protein Bbelb_252540 [Branchiostoma belcheri]|nr:hypothetical protein Bbelb_252540 [Branchiostoma belcheri]
MVVARITRHMVQRLQQARSRSGERTAERADVLVNQSAVLLTLLGITISSFSVHRMSFSRQIKKNPPLQDTGLEILGACAPWCTQIWSCALNFFLCRVMLYSRINS